MSELRENPIPTGWDQMALEHSSWQRVCKLLEARGIVVNDDDELVRSIERWGEELVALRVAQTPDLRARVLYEKRGLDGPLN